MANKTTIDLSSFLKQLDGSYTEKIPVQTLTGIEQQDAPTLGVMLGQMLIVHKTDKPLRLIEWGEALTQTGKLEVSAADIKDLQEVVNENAKNNLVKVRIGSVLDAALTELNNE